MCIHKKKRVKTVWRSRAPMKAHRRGVHLHRKQNLNIYTRTRWSFLFINASVTFWVYVLCMYIHTMPQWKRSTLCKWATYHKMRLPKSASSVRGVKMRVNTTKDRSSICRVCRRNAQTQNKESRHGGDSAWERGRSRSRWGSAGRPYKPMVRDRCDDKPYIMYCVAFFYNLYIHIILFILAMCESDIFP